MVKLRDPRFPADHMRNKVAEKPKKHEHSYRKDGTCACGKVHKPKV